MLLNWLFIIKNFLKTDDKRISNFSGEGNTFFVSVLDVLCVRAISYKFKSKKAFYSLIL